MDAPTPNISVANDFHHDAHDFLNRYHRVIDSWGAIKSRRLKAFIDLRMACECSLKSAAAYYLMGDLDRQDSIRRIEGYSHHLDKIANDVTGKVPQEASSPLMEFIPQLARLPIGLRYALDVFDFLDASEGFYYDTVGNDFWLANLNAAIKVTWDHMQAELSKHSRIVSASDLIKELGPALYEGQYNKYRK